MVKLQGSHNMSGLNNKPNSSCRINNELGQSFIEFMFLFLIMLFISRVMIYGLDKGIGTQWEKLIKKIAAPTPDTIKLR